MVSAIADNSAPPRWGARNELASASNTSKIPSNDKYDHSTFPTGMKGALMELRDLKAFVTLGEVLH
ncbi:MAG: hypothetical protein ACRCUF_10175, partial [Aeromonas sobria]